MVQVGDTSAGAAPAAEHSATLLEVAAVSKRFGGVVANDRISLRVPAGGIVGLIGPNGSGKTTLFNSIVGHHRVDSGSIRLDGKEITGRSVPDIVRMGVLRTYQHTRVYGRLSCLQNMQISIPPRQESLRAMLLSVPRAVTGRADELLAFVGLESKRSQLAEELSFGQRKLLEFAMALMCAPRLLLLDEPTAGINPTLINGMLERLHRSNAELGVTLLVIEHNMRVMMQLARHIYCLANGRVLVDGTPEQVQSDRRVVEVYLGTRR